MSHNPVLKIENLESFYGPIMAIRGVSLEVRQGQIVTILGANGAGKTTLLKTISGVMEPAKGTIELNGEQIAGVDADKIVAKNMVHVPEGREIFPLLSVKQNIDIGAYSQSDKTQTAKNEQLIYEYFPILKQRHNQQAGTLSGGQQQMLAIARGLMANPKIMLLDEPSLGLSPLLVEEIFTILKRLNKEQNVTMLLVEQNAKTALNIADYGYVMELGRIVMADKAEKLENSPDIQSFYLGVIEDNERGKRRWKQRKTWR